MTLTIDGWRDNEGNIEQKVRTESSERDINQAYIFKF